MFRAVCRSSSGAPNVFAASGLHTHAVTARSQVWVGTPHSSHSDLYIKSSTCFERYVAHHQEPQMYLQPLVYIRMWWPPVVKSKFPLRLDYGRSPHAYVNQRLQIQLGLLMMRDIPHETCWAFNVLWNNKFRYQVASCWLLLLSHSYLLSKSVTTFSRCGRALSCKMCGPTPSKSGRCLCISLYNFCIQYWNLKHVRNKAWLELLASVCFAVAGGERMG